MVGLIVQGQPYAEKYIVSIINKEAFVIYVRVSEKQDSISHLMQNNDEMINISVINMNATNQ